MSNSSWAQAAAADPCVYIVLYELLLQQGPVRGHSGVGTIVWNNVEWLGTGEMGAVSALSGGVDLEVQEVELSLSGVPSAFRDDVRAAVTRGRTANIYHGFWNNQTGAWVRAPELAFSGFVSHAEIRDQAGEDGQANIAISVTLLAAFAYLRRLSVARRTDAHQQGLFPGDQFYQFKTDASSPIPSTGAAPGAPHGGFTPTDFRRFLIARV